MSTEEHVENVKLIDYHLFHKIKNVYLFIVEIQIHARMKHNMIKTKITFK